MSCSTNFTCACDDDDVEERTAMQLQFCYEVQIKMRKHEE